MVDAAGFRAIPKGAVKIADKNSDAIAYLYDVPKGPAAVVYYGKQSKPVVRCYFIPFRGKTAEQYRADKIAEAFKGRQAWAARKAKRAQDRKDTGRGVEVGQFLAASWGYEQTNVDFYKIVGLVGKTMAEVVKVGAIDVGGGGVGNSMASKVIPAEEPAEGAEVLRVVVKAGGAKVRGQWASVWDGTPRYVSWYA